MLLLILGLVLFLGIHLLSIVSPCARLTLMEQLGLVPYKAVSGLIAIDCRSGYLRGGHLLAALAADRCPGRAALAHH